MYPQLMQVVKFAPRVQSQNKTRNKHLVKMINWDLSSGSKNYANICAWWIYEKVFATINVYYVYYDVIDQIYLSGNTNPVKMRIQKFRKNSSYQQYRIEAIQE